MCDCDVSSLCVSRTPVFLQVLWCLIHTFEIRILRREMSDVDDGTRAAKARCRRSASRSAVDRRACVSAYLAKKAIGANDSVAESVARSGPRRCATPSDSMSDADRVEMARCLRAMAPPTAGAALAMSTLVHQHLWTPPAAPPPQCKPLGTSATTTTVRGASSASAECVKSAGMASWSVSGLASENGSECGRHWQSTAEVRCLCEARTATTAMPHCARAFVRAPRCAACLFNDH